MKASTQSAPVRKRPGRDNRWMFFALFVIVGLLALIPFAIQAVRDYRIASMYEQAECEIVAHRMVETTTIYRWGGGDRTEQRSSHPEFTFKFRAEGGAHIVTGLDNHDGVTAPFESWRDFHVGGRYPCWYDPADPEEAVLLRRFEWKFYLGALIPVFFILVCGNLMRRALSAKHDYGRGAKWRGVRLRYRLAPTLSHQKLTGCLLLIIIMLALALIGIWVAPWHTRTTQILSPMLYLFGIVAVIEGLIIYHFIRAVRAVGVAEPEVEIYDEPLLPGQSTALSILQRGPLKARMYQVLLVCEEVSSDTRTPVKEKLIDQDLVEIRDAEEFNARTFTARFTVPAKARPSTRGLQFIRTWNIRVVRKLDEKSKLETDFPFRVLKKVGGGDSEPASDEESEEDSKED